MEVEYSNSSAQRLWLIAIILRNLPDLLSLSNAQYQFIWYLCLSSAVAATITLFLLFDRNLSFFILLFIFRYVRLVVNLIAFYCYKPIAILEPSNLMMKDVTVIVPTVEPYGEYFVECIRSIHGNRPAEIIVVTAGPGNYDKAIRSIGMYSNVRIINCTVQNKRKQVCKALPEV